MVLDAGSASIDDGASTLTLHTDQGVALSFDGDNYYTMRGMGSTTVDSGSPAAGTSPGGGGGGGTFYQETYIVVTPSANLTAERVATGSFNVTITDNGTGSPGTIVWDLSETGVTPGTYGATFSIPVIAVDKYGRITSATSASHVGQILVADEGSLVDAVAQSLNFTGGGVTASDAGFHISTIDVPLKAPLDASYVVLSPSSDLTNERILTAGSNISLTDNGTGSPGTVVIGCTLTAGGNDQAQEFTSSGTFNVPTGVSLVRLTMIGAGGGGSSRNLAAGGGGGGGSGELVVDFPVPVTAGAAITVTIGALGAGAVGAGGAVAGSDGGNTSFGSWTVLGGKGGNTVGSGGVGGGSNGGAAGATGNPAGVGALGTSESTHHYGGSGGSGGGNNTTIAGAAGRAGPGFSTGAAGGTAVARAHRGGLAVPAATVGRPALRLRPRPTARAVAGRAARRRPASMVATGQRVTSS